MELITIPLFTGVIGYITNWTGVLMLFAPLRFYGFHLPGLKFAYPYLPRRVQVLPVFHSDGRIGWQGMVPSRAEKMASIAVDKSLSKLGSVSDFYRELDPDSIAEQFVKIAQPEIRELVHNLMRRENPRLWYNLPGFAKEAIYRRVESELPENASRITATLGDHIEELLDPKWMAIRHLTEHPKLLNSIFREMGAKELKFMVNFGFYFGYPMGFVLVGVLHLLPFWWVLPLGGVVIGYIVNYLGITLIYEPIQPTRWLPWRQGLMLKRRPEVIGGFADLIADDVITTENIAKELMFGPRSDRTRQMLETVMGGAIDHAVGRARIAVKMSVGSEEYDRLQVAIAPAAMKFATDAMSDREFSAQQAGRIRLFVATQMSKLSLEDFVDLLRSATKQDEWLLFVHGAVLGSLGGFLHLAIFGV
ncbi:hypothetical protein [Antrihabitans cavernicola]|uniref:DUF445 family protein n=1 Tax=Antrihabitans cavernicola TaxID=2495913 RepID=A0A5A7SFH1_9NOCA|nr:hypothetical protein [Spelaeibacter cavernicola]KAA0024324.1 hypothetical protein FOY51_04320 [Spelaeibacter cavernicola]